jgi:hypothetical protein
MTVHTAPPVLRVGGRLMASRSPRVSSISARVFRSKTFLSIGPRVAVRLPRVTENGPETLPKPSIVRAGQNVVESERHQQALGASGAAAETKPRRARRVFSAAGKLRILAEAASSSRRGRAARRLHARACGMRPVRRSGSLLPGTARTSASGFGRSDALVTPRGGGRGDLRCAGGGMIVESGRPFNVSTWSATS